MKYRYELDGLRGFAVLSVIFYHASLTIHGIPIFQGGFYGVDVFFVLSGYLITGILNNSFEKHYSGEKSFSLWDFYKRRAKRIVPAMIVMLCGSMVLAYFLLLPDELLRYVQSLKSALFFYSNHSFLNEDSYTAPVSVFKPLLHTWSLAVEWQFYMVFPFIFWAIFKFTHKHLLSLVLTLAAISFFSATYIVKISPDTAFYTLATRAWELLIGGVIALLPRKELLKHLPLSLKHIIPTVAFIVLGYSFVFIDHNVLHPSWITLLAVFSTALFILFSNEEDIYTKLLSSKIMTFFGAISYSLYLWHQPIFSYFRIFKNKILVRPEQFLLLLIISILLAWLSTKFVENVFRKHKIPKAGLGCLIICALGVLSFSHWVDKYEGNIQRSFMLDVFNDIGNDNYFKINNKHCFNQPFEQACKIKGKNKEIILLGDSHSGRLAEPLYNYAQSNQNSFIEFSVSNCKGISGISPKKGTWYNMCVENIDKYKKYINNSKDSLIIYTLSMGNINAGKTNNNKKPPQVIKSQLEKWADSGHQVLVVYDTPYPKGDIPNIIRTKVQSFVNKQKAYEDLDLSTPYKLHFKKMKNAYELFDSMGDSIERAYPYKALCSDKTQRCYAKDKESIYYTDASHLSRQGAKLVFDKEIRPVLDDILK